ncbi:MAG: WhiB family transcriptional regulator, partial [Acidimicrobiales bacterium]|nr:WhiB family transcriptional regulator [Acidimicrobiales bacterium]
MSKGNCADRPPSEFFPSDGVGVDRARKVCATCPVKEVCL